MQNSYLKSPKEREKSEESLRSGGKKIGDNFKIQNWKVYAHELWKNVHGSGSNIEAKFPSEPKIFVNKICGRKMIISTKIMRVLFEYCRIRRMKIVVVETGTLANNSYSHTMCIYRKQQPRIKFKTNAASPNISWSSKHRTSKTTEY